MKPFNFYKISAVFEQMRDRSFLNQTIGVLDRKTGRCFYIGHVDDLPKLIEYKVDLQHALFIPKSGRAHDGLGWEINYYPEAMINRFILDYLPDLTENFFSLKRPLSDEIIDQFDENIFAHALSDILPFGNGLCAALDVYDWCIKNEIPLMESKRALEEFTKPISGV